MGSLWTPGGEHPVDRERDEAAAPAPDGPPLDPSSPAPSDLDPQEQAELAAQVAAVQEELARTPAAVVVANHAIGLFQLAALHLNRQPASLDEGRLAIDAMGALVEGMAGRLGEEEAALLDGLAQLRLAFVALQGQPSGDVGT